ncbi:hypothetical protein AruPA_10040 [Acidiphilium sp. PA]|uniref:hypothetical protein n=1 Tax=Acidiphilium sp. PA TaxID=2871705 RepID=UPI002244DCC4|nr:hypothetical protein [Acidiphilium sp. PA]MCW8307375.1 hypothetical protein [Acidiphilium sp. PA]
MTADDVMPDDDCQAIDPAVILMIIRVMKSVVVRLCMIVIDVPTVVHGGVLPALPTTSTEGAVS